MVPRDVVESGSAHLVKGLQNWLHDGSGLQTIPRTRRRRSVSWSGAMSR
ncbi:MAG: hypothetical protein IPF55_21495 [Rhodoferax sp.]|nr:hypothetical protein [Rhodoferax sp.]